jgi:hypothetical protein
MRYPAKRRSIGAGFPKAIGRSRGAFSSCRASASRKTRTSGIKFLLKHGETGFLMEHDRNTADHLYNVDHPDVQARREDVGARRGAVMQSVREVAICLDGIPIESTYGHAGGAVVQHAPFALAAYWTVARRRGIPLEQLGGTGQSDFFLTYLGCVTEAADSDGCGFAFERRHHRSSAGHHAEVGARVDRRLQRRRHGIECLAGIRCRDRECDRVPGRGQASRPTRYGDGQLTGWVA